MDVSPEYIRKKEFHIVLKGYKAEEVDKFLDVISVEFERIISKNKELQENLERLKFQSHNEENEMKKVLQDALVSAHRIAEEIKEKAKKETEQLIENKKSQEEQAYKEMLSKRQELEEKIKIIEDKYKEFKSKVRSITGEFEKLMDKIDDSAKIYDLRKVLEESRPEDEKFQSDEIDEYMGDENFTDRKEDDVHVEQKDDASSNDISEVDKNEDEDIKNKQTETDKNIENKKAEENYTKQFKDEEKEKEVKRPRKKIDIADSDIINEFFRTDED